MMPKNTAFTQTFSINCQGKLLLLKSPLVMGVLNITPDSFYSGSHMNSADKYLPAAAQMLSEGAAILDIGGQSTRPRAELLDPKQEMERVLPAIDNIRQHHPDAILSIDTFYAEVAEAAVAHGCHIVNDISAGNMDHRMIETVARLGTPFIAMHMQGTPASMQIEPHYEDVVQDILDFFIHKTAECHTAGIHDVLIDPGFGFGKKISHNYTILHHLSVFHMLKVPIVIGLSRKSMIWQLLNITSEEALNGTTVLHTLALQQGAHILRTHDVKAAMETIRLWQYYQQQR